jgi:hypothetical protein
MQIKKAEVARIFEKLRLDLKGRSGNRFIKTEIKRMVS